MTKKDFDNYRFSKNTRVKYKGEWESIKGVNWLERSVIIRLMWIFYEEIEDIKEEE